jgi:hypothetical protein
VVTAACYSGDQAAPGFADSCARVVSSLSLSEVRAFPLSPYSDLGRAVRGAVARINAARGEHRAALRQAATPAAQSAAAAALADAYRRAGASLEGRVSPQVASARAELQAAIRRTSDAYRSMSAAARANRRSAYRKAADAVQRGDAAVARALRRLEQLGYDVG